MMVVGIYAPETKVRGIIIMELNSRSRNVASRGSVCVQTTSTLVPVYLVF